MTTETKIPVWLDCDPGHDDAIAILMSVFLPWFHLVGISTVHGNASLENTTTNAISVLTAFEQYGINVYPGAEKPLKRELQVAQDIHGKSGLDGTALLPSPGFSAQADHTAVPAMAQAIRDYPGQISIVCTGTLTNLAQLVEKHPDLVPKIKNVGIMGGGIDQGNWTDYAEFNIWCDPHASQIALTNPVLAPKTIIVPINVTHTAIATEEILQRIQKGRLYDKSKTESAAVDNMDSEPYHRSLVRQMLYELLTFFADTYKHQFGFVDGPPVHDPLALVALLPFYQDYFKDDAPPDLAVKYDQCKVDVVVDGEQKGQIVTCEKSSEGLMIATSLDVPKFWRLVLQALDALDEHIQQ